MLKSYGRLLVQLFCCCLVCIALVMGNKNGRTVGKYTFIFISYHAARDATSSRALPTPTLAGKP